MKYLLKRIGILITLTVIAGVLQFYIVNFLQVKMFYSTAVIYVFHFLVTLFISIGIYFVSQKENEHTGYAFLVSSVLRILASIVFLIPLIKADISNKISDILAFMVPYFIFLIFEAQYAICLMNRKKHTSNM